MPFQRKMHSSVWQFRQRGDVFKSVIPEMIGKDNVSIDNGLSTMTICQISGLAKE